MTHIFKSEGIRVRTPDGTLYLTILQNADGSIHSFIINIGKAGAPISAWASAMAAMMTLAISKGASIEDLLETLSNITSDREARTFKTLCRSGPEGIWQALLKYRQGGASVYEADEHTHELRGASVASWARTANR